MFLYNKQFDNPFLWLWNIITKNKKSKNKNVWQNLLKRNKYQKWKKAWRIADNSLANQSSLDTTTDLFIFILVLTPATAACSKIDILS